MMTSIVTLGIGLLPTYQKIGLWAPLLLLILRFFQGISFGGEFTGAAVFVTEHNPRKSYWSSSWISTASGIGMLIGGIAAMIIRLPGMPSWAWRVPFCLGALAALIEFYIRRRLAETTTYQELLAADAIARLPLKTLFTQHKKALLQTAAVASYGAIYIYICNVWWITYGQIRLFQRIDRAWVS